MRVLIDPETGEMVEVLPNDVAGLEPYDFAQAKRAVMNATRERRTAERELREAVNTKAKAQSHYRKVKATAILKAKAEHGATVADTVASGQPDVAQAYEERIAAEGLERAAQERLRLCSEDRASLHRLIEWSMAAPGATGQSS